MRVLCRLFGQRPVSRLSSTPSSFMAAPQERKRSVNITSGRPCRFLVVFGSPDAALQSRAFAAKLSRTSPS
jgi:trimethylamine:corrinoid methyltransferase-like protein